MPLRVAILYTGQIRTIEKTSPWLRKNVLNTTQADMFAIIEPTDRLVDEPIIERLTETYWRDNLRSFSWFDKMEYTNLQDELLVEMNLPQYWSQYLKTSGSMIEYYQLYIGFQQLCIYELEHGFKYDYIMRIRTDVIITSPIDLSGFTNNPINILENHYYSCTSIEQYMNSLLSLDRMLSPRILDQTPNKTLLSVGSIYEQFRRDFLITIRKNVFYIGTRSAFDDISLLGINYGRWRSNRDHWFDAESQLHALCEQNGIDVFDSTTELEDKSLYEYDSQHYFEENGEIIPTFDVFCFICRN